LGQSVKQPRGQLVRRIDVLLSQALELRCDRTQHDLQFTRQAASMIRHWCRPWHDLILCNCNGAAAATATSVRVPGCLATSARLENWPSLAGKTGGTLTGFAERAHLLGREIDLDTRVLDIVGSPQYRNLNELPLIGGHIGGRGEGACTWFAPVQMSLGIGNPASTAVAHA
jgi:hypothetical protein